MLPSNYLQMPADLSGSMSKNRFRLEMLWGIYRIFDIYDKTDNFVVMFDYICDVEIYTDSEDTYYQLKTKKETKPYTVQTLCADSKAKDGSTLHSILGKLYLILAASDPQRAVKVAVVSNVGFKAGKKEYTDKLELPLIEIDAEAKEKICKALERENKQANVDLCNAYYIRTYMDLANPQETLVGRMVRWFADNKGCEIKNPQALYLSLSDAVKEKASYEWKGTSIDDLEYHKGLSKQQFDRLIQMHTQSAADGIQLSRQWISDNIQSYANRLQMQQDLGRIVQYLPSDERLHTAMDNIKIIIESGDLPQDLNTAQTIDYLSTKISRKSLSDYSDGQIRMLVLVTIMRMEEIACQY